MWKQYIRQNPDTPARTLDGEAIVITPDDSVLHTLNETATFIWELAEDGSRTLEQIATELVAAFEVDDDTARREALAFVEDAVRRGLLLATDRPAAP